MLVLGRQPGEYVMIGENIKVKVIRSTKGDLRLAIEAPQDVIIVRGEVYEQQHPQQVYKQPRPQRQLNNFS